MCVNDTRPIQQKNQKPAEIVSCLEIADQALSLLTQLSNEQYIKIEQPYLQSSIGQHMRHILDSFHCVMSCLNSNYVDYNLRRRHHLVETKKEIAINEWTDIAEKLQQISHNIMQNQVDVINEASSIDRRIAKNISTLGREFIFVSSHAIHHFALIRVSLCVQNIDPMVCFGMAPATITSFRGKN